MHVPKTAHPKAFLICSCVAICFFVYQLDIILQYVCLYPKTDKATVKQLTVLLRCLLTVVSVNNSDAGFTTSNNKAQ